MESSHKEYSDGNEPMRMNSKTRITILILLLLGTLVNLISAFLHGRDGEWVNFGLCLACGIMLYVTGIGVGILWKLNSISDRLTEIETSSNSLS